MHGALSGALLADVRPPSDVVRASWDVPASFRDAKLAAAAYFSPSALILESGLLAASLLAERFLNLAPTRFQLEMARTRKHSGWFPGNPGEPLVLSGLPWEAPIHWQSIRELTELADQYHHQLAVLLMPINEEVVKKDARIRQRFSALLGEYCRQVGILYADLLHPPYPKLEGSEYMRDGLHIATEGARKLSLEVSRRIVIPMLKRSATAGGKRRKDVGAKGIRHFERPVQANAETSTQGAW